MKDKAPERIWAVMGLDGIISFNDYDNGEQAYVRADLAPRPAGEYAMSDEIERLRSERDAAIAALCEAARARGRAEGKLEASEMAGVVDVWKARAERAEADRGALREALYRILTLDPGNAPEVRDAALDAWWSSLCSQYRMIAAAALKHSRGDK